MHTKQQHAKGQLEVLSTYTVAVDIYFVRSTNSTHGGVVYIIGKVSFLLCTLSLNFVGARRYGIHKRGSLLYVPPKCNLAQEGGAVSVHASGGNVSLHRPR